MVEEETLEGGPKGGGKEELGEEEWVSFNTLSLMKTKIWQDYSISLELKRGEEMSFFCLRMNGRGGIYSSGGGNMNEMPLNEGWQGIMNLDLILAFGEIWRIKCGDWWEWGASKVRFSCSYCNSLYSQLRKIISDSILIGIVLFLYSNWSPGCLVSGKINFIHRFKIFWEISMKWWAEVIC